MAKPQVLGIVLAGLKSGKLVNGLVTDKIVARELQVLQLICDGLSNREIAAALDLSANTISVHRTNIMTALGVHKAAELVVYAIRHGLVQP